MLILFLFAVLHVTRPIISEPKYWDRSLHTKKEEIGRKYDNGVWVLMLSGRVGDL